VGEVEGDGEEEEGASARSNYSIQCWRSRRRRSMNLTRGTAVVRMHIDFIIDFFHLT